MSRMVPYEETLSIEFKSENWLNGVGAKMFTIAGPVIVYGVTASVIYGVILVLLQSFLNNFAHFAIGEVGIFLYVYCNS